MQIIHTVHNHITNIPHAYVIIIMIMRLDYRLTYVGQNEKGANETSIFNIGSFFFFNIYDNDRIGLGYHISNYLTELRRFVFCFKQLRFNNTQAYV